MIVLMMMKGVCKMMIVMISADGRYVYDENYNGDSDSKDESYREKAYVCLRLPNLLFSFQFSVL